MLLLNSPEKYHYLKQSGCYGDPSINDKEDFNNVMVCQLQKNCLYYSLLNYSQASLSVRNATVYELLTSM